MKRIIVIAMVILVCGCSSRQIPEWEDTAARQLQNYVKNFLTDKEDATEPHFIKAKKAISSNNDLNLLATAYLTKYALHTSSLQDFDDSDFIRINKLEAIAANTAYYHLLKGNFTAADVSLLPSQYASFAKKARDKDLSKALKDVLSIDDPLSRLVACGIWTKHLPLEESVLQTAINTSAANGWRRPLWAYLTQLQKYYSDRGEMAKASAIKERMELLKK